MVDEVAVPVEEEVSLFSEEELEEASWNPESEESEESDDAEEVETEQEQEDDGEEEEGEDDSEEEEPNPLEEINANLNAALKESRDKVKAEAKHRKDLEAQLEVLKSSTTSDEQLESIIKQLEEHNLEGLIKVDKPAKLDPKMQRLLDLQEEQESLRKEQSMVADMRTAVTENISQFKNIDEKSLEHGKILGMLISGSVGRGADMEEATKSSLELLDTVLKSKEETVKKARKAPVKPTKKVRTATKARKDNSAKRKIAKGDFSGLFSDMGKQMAGT